MNLVSVDKMVNEETFEPKLRVTLDFYPEFWNDLLIHLGPVEGPKEFNMILGGFFRENVIQPLLNQQNNV